VNPDAQIPFDLLFYCRALQIVTKVVLEPTVMHL